ncbi:MAG: hypothetical protein ACK4PH_02130 [Aquincola tertiaricarbonis]|uniref:hypothetical protein n=1 Tax=Aquincola sp. J276 TaxID=2898432 RepID=UPI002150E08A|nr:hypothetical protein [Aquincola sp. J276]MCR5868599.1 hypothetical protein [Aquincola sp. J276]
MTNPTQVSGPGRPMNERRDAVKEQEGLAEVLDGGTELEQANDTPEQQAMDNAESSLARNADRAATGSDNGDAGGQATGRKAG